MSVTKWILASMLTLSACTVNVNGQDGRFDRLEALVATKANTKDVVDGMNQGFQAVDKRIKALENSPR